MRRTLIALLLVAGACASDKPPRFSTRGITTSSISTTVAPATTMPASTAPPGAPSCNVPARAQPDPNRPRYQLTVNIDLAARKVTGTVHVAFTPDIDIDRLVFRVWANSPRITRHGGNETVHVEGNWKGAWQPDPSTLAVPVAPRGSAGKTFEIDVSYDLTLPSSPTSDRIALSGDNLRLGSFFPILAWEPGVGWATDPPVDAFAEASTAPTADFDVTVNAPGGLDVLASGTTTDGVHWKANAMRDFALSMGRFRKAEVVSQGVRIIVGASADVADAPETYARKLADKLALFTRLFGAYPWPWYTMAITPDLSGGIEYPGHVMQGPTTSGRTTTHELAHQWFYGLVGDNQSRNPWLDEGLATYAEARGENTVTAVRAAFIPPDARGQLDEQMPYWSQHRASYYDGVYIQGAKASAALGPTDRVDCALRIYVARNAYRIARASDFVSAMSAVFPDAPAKLAPYGVTSAP